MNEKQLYMYLQAVKRCANLEQQINVLYTRINSPRSVSYGMPKSSSKAPGDWLADMENKLEQLQKLYRKVCEEQNEQYFVLIDVSFALEREIEQDLFWLLYHDGKSISEAARKIGYSKGHTYRLRNSILSQIKKLNAPNAKN